MQRRQLMGASVALAGAWAFQACAADLKAPFPRLRIFIPANAGGGWDQTGRTLGQALLASGQVAEVDYENKGGKGGVIGLAEFAQKHAKDPAALMVGGFVMVGSVALNRPAVDLSQLTPIARLTNELPVLVVPADSRYRNLAAFTADLTARPTQVTIAGGGAGGVDHMCAAMIARAAGADPALLAYQPFASGSEVLAAVTAGKVSAAVSGYGELHEGIASGRLRALGITSKRAAYGVPSMMEQGLKVELGNWRGVFAAGGLSADQAATLRNAVQRATQDASWKDAVQRNSWQASWQTGAEFQQSLEFDQQMARVLVHLLHLKPA
ncbi:Bug family tripartite tricarboxylate transporter substrate binding protein [Ideonella sp. BN130291]|uniref:Bug family tripartite tricarboxylate transporter substrate binding protein n=1 Tax=Ideonella sp. BN130291 TaxID=3112940 RepID=UPI002E270837|nr:tripartite tricarboxylate transporter substrate-binding protein [Ideonella sp. BN130291]